MLSVCLVQWESGEPAAHCAPQGCWRSLGPYLSAACNVLPMSQVGLKCVQVDLEAFSSTMEVQFLPVATHPPC
jgi:hypothetical protein